ncbi:nuclear transport factor 2 family protein [Thalassococcus sp. S3]|uniref:nuclear transport factor 2 family protein n=1 Tax=Thalassococcus sp. S3 TaxID=2017482 RepID=UPI0013EE67B3|nr:nuclear transport factor 2 family protein [Thalassococcus sp. S3]
MQTPSQLHQSGLEFLRAYNQCFYDKDLVALKGLYSSTSFTVFWDNHPNCDSNTLDDHFEKLSTFFSKGKLTESGSVEPLLIEELQTRASSGMLLVTAILRYQSAPIPGVRSSFVLVEEDGRWKALHIHHSFDPNEPA